MQVKNLKELAETPKYVKYVLKIKSLEVASESAGENYESWLFVLLSNIF